MPSPASSSCVELIPALPSKSGVRPESLGIISAMSACVDANRIYMHLSFGRVVDELARRYQRVYLCLPLRHGAPTPDRDYRLAAANVTLVPQPYYRDSTSALRHLPGITKAFRHVLNQADHVFVRGMIPFVGLFYPMVWMHRRRSCHWIVGNPVALLQSHRRLGGVRDRLALAYALVDRGLTRVGRWMNDGAFLCNGQELAEVFRSPRTRTVVSTTLREDEFHVREDTCQSSPIRILFVGFVRPEKGLEYLFEALGRLPVQIAWQLDLIGPTNDYPAYSQKLCEAADRLGIADRINWHGYVPYGPQMWRFLRACDLFVLPTLSEGTPRVLVEARANSLPIVATNVGGIPTSVRDGHDGLLVPPKDPAALADAMARIIGDSALRRSLIRNGLESARELTVERFCDTVVQMLVAD